MDPVLQALRKQRVITALVPLFLASGATSLVYETLWERQLAAPGLVSRAAPAQDAHLRP